MTVDKVRDSKICLDIAQIKALMDGELAPDEMATVILHASTCERCRQELRAAGFYDVTLSQQAAHTVDTAHGEAAPHQQAERPTTKTDATKIWPAVPGQSPAFPFLAAPQASDELGRLGQFRILRVLGEGGMGTVFEAEDALLQRRVAVKVLRYGLDNNTRQRFLQEAQLAASLASDRIVTIYHIGEDRGCPYIAMELLQGESLDDRLRRAKHLSLADALRIAREAAEGLAVAHEKGLIHRDIKPANVWLERRSAAEADFRVKLLDFGIARSIASDSRLTEDGMIVGTPSYMCPEQAHSAPLDARSDLFSLGCLIYAMLAGESPFARSNTIQSIRAVAEEEATPIRNKLPHLPTQVSHLIHRLLSKNPKDRPAHARGVAEEIRCLEMLVQPTVGLPEGLPTSLGREALRARMKLGWGGWAGIAAVLMAALVGLWAQYDHIAGKHRPAKLGGKPDSAASVPASAVPLGTIPAATADGGSKSAALPVPAVALPPIKVGILHSFSGPMATSERSVADATLFAIEEINAAGGVLGGRQIEPVIRDGRSYPEDFAAQAEDLISQEHVATLFGVWRSSCRKAVEQVCRKHNNLLVFPKADEGLEQSPYVIYMGGAPNQQITPAVKWAYAFLGKRKFFLVGTEGLFSRTSHEIIKDEIAALGASVVGEELGAVGDADFTAAVAAAKKSGADVVLNTISGSGNVAFFRALYAAGLKPDVMPVISYDLTEEELRTLTQRADLLAGNYAAWSYFQSLPEKANQDFIQRYRKRYGQTRTVNDPMAAAYAGVHLWAKGVDAAKSDHPADIRKAMVQQKFDAPEGLVTIDPATQRAVRMARIGQISKDLEFDVVWMSPKPIAPQVFPATRTRQAWEEYVDSLRQRWGGDWTPESTASGKTPEADEKTDSKATSP